MDYVEAAAERIELYELTDDDAPTSATSPTCSHRAADAGRAGASAGCARSRSRRRRCKLCIDINRLENEADAILRRSVARLFKEEKDPITVIKWKEIYENLENATDRCEDVANIIEGVILEHA